MLSHSGWTASLNCRLQLLLIDVLGFFGGYELLKNKHRLALKPLLSIGNRIQVIVMPKGMAFPLLEWQNIYITHIAMQCHIQTPNHNPSREMAHFHFSHFLILHEEVASPFSARH